VCGIAEWAQYWRVAGDLCKGCEDREPFPQQADFIQKDVDLPVAMDMAPFGVEARA
jgi:hypothetical protein